MCQVDLIGDRLQFFKRNLNPNLFVNKKNNIFNVACFTRGLFWSFLAS
jgi:hypothetical protein